MYCPFCGQNIQVTFQYCPFCGNHLQGFRNAEEQIPGGDDTCDELIAHYFREGFAYEKIMQFLGKFHGINISLRTLNTKLRSLGLRRRNKEYDLSLIRQRIQHELDGPGSSAGYRSVWHTLQREGYQVPRETIRVFVNELDPDGVRERQGKTLRRRTYHNPGPNYAWHVDGYDKLKPYGFPVHGCIDGYSRKVLWLKVCKTNNNPAVTSQHFLDAVKKYGGCPTLLRTDNGTENVIMAAMQAYFRTSGDDEMAGINAHRYDFSQSNQRIESWWAFLQKNRSNWWMNCFKDMIETGHLNTSSDLDKECLWYCFANLLQEDLTSVKRNWNSHYIRKSRFDTVAGRPDELYFLPECNGAQNYAKQVTDAQFLDMSQYCHEYMEENVIQGYYCTIGNELGMSQPTHWRRALEMYHILRGIAQS